MPPTQRLAALTLSIALVFSMAATALGQTLSQIHIKASLDRQTSMTSFQAYAPDGTPRGYIGVRCYKDNKGDQRDQVATSFPAPNMSHYSTDDQNRALFLQRQASESTVCNRLGKPDRRVAAALLRNVNDAKTSKFDN